MTHPAPLANSPVLCADCGEAIDLSEEVFWSRLGSKLEPLVVPVPMHMFCGGKTVVVREEPSMGNFGRIIGYGRAWTGEPSSPYLDELNEAPSAEEIARIADKAFGLKAAVDTKGSNNPGLSSDATIEAFLETYYEGGRIKDGVHLSWDTKPLRTTWRDAAGLVIWGAFDLVALPIRLLLRLMKRLSTGSPTA